jgi:hypothetical protein
MRKRLNLMALTITLAGGWQVVHPAVAAATMTASAIEWNYCCSGGRQKCCGANWCAITPRGCATG